MKRFFLSSFFLTLVMSTFQNQVLAENEPYRPCAQEDVLGTWIMAHQIINAKVDTHDPFYFKYQRYVFEEDKTMKHLTSNQPLTQKERDLEENTPAHRTYSVAADGSMILKKQNSSDVETMTCSYITDEKPNTPVITPHKGDILLTFFVKQDQPPVLFRLLRREKN